MFKLYKIASVFFLPLSVAASEILTLPSGGGTFDLVPYVEYFLDDTKLLSIDDLSGSRNGLFREAEDRFLQIGNLDQACWIRFRYSAAKSRERWLLYIDYPHLKSVELYTSDERGHFTLAASAGQMFPFRMRDFFHRNFVFELPANEEGIIYIRLKSDYQAKLSLSAMDEATFREKNDEELLFYGVAFGTISVMAIVNLFFFITIRDRVYLLYVFYSLSFLVLVLNIKGFTYQYVWPNAVEWNLKAQAIIAIVALLLMIVFINEFLQLSRYQPSAYRLFRFLMVALVVSVPALIWRPSHR
jgi:hypothetical protein